MDCQYCSKQVETVGGDVIYPHRPDLWYKKFCLCRDCNAYVGCHGRGNLPLGTVAKAELRALRSKCHELFDPLWKTLRKAPRNRCYAWLRERVDVDEAPYTLRNRPIHFGSCNEEECLFIIKSLEEWNEN